MMVLPIQNRPRLGENQVPWDFFCLKTEGQDFFGLAYPVAALTAYPPKNKLLVNGK